MKNIIKFSFLISSLWLVLIPKVALALPQLNGMAIHNELGHEQFIAAVYIDNTTKDARPLILSDENKALEVRVLADIIYARRFNRMWIEGMAINSGSRELEQQAQNLADFGNMMRIKLRAGDILRIERSTGQGTTVFVNGLKLGFIADPTFFDLLLRTWVGPVPLSSDFKDALLGGGNVPDKLFQRFRNIHPSPERISAISAALTKGNHVNSSSSALPAVAEASSSSSSSSTQVVMITSAKSSASAVVTNPTTNQKSSKSTNPASAATTPIGIVSEEDLFADETIFDGDEEDFSFTAEQLLSEQLFISKLTKWTGNYVKYPKFSIRNEQQGTVRLTVTLARDGKVKDIQFLEKSRYEQLNRAAGRAVTTASPYPAIPEEIKGETFVFTVPVVFRLQ